MRSTHTFACSVLLLIVCSASATSAQVTRRGTISEQPPTGSRPYRAAVRSFLDSTQVKVVGGAKAPPGAYPWQVSLGVSWIADSYHAHFCGGTVYSSRWIVTAAHCVDGNTARDVVITAGTNVLGGGSRRNVRRIIVRADYDSVTMSNDIALLELQSELPLSKSVQSIKLLRNDAESSILVKDAPMIVLGWGATIEGGEKVRDLRFAQVPAIDRAVCNRPLVYDGRITDGMLCAGTLTGGDDACQGDSGGPLTAATMSDPVLAGVVSWGEGCARPNKPGVYTRVPRYVVWIEQCVQRPAECR